MVNTTIGSGFPSHIGDHISRGLLLQSGFVMRGGCNMAMNCDIYCIRSRPIEIEDRNGGESGCTLKGLQSADEMFY